MNTHTHKKKIRSDVHTRNLMKTHTRNQMKTYIHTRWTDTHTHTHTKSDEHTHTHTLSKPERTRSRSTSPLSQIYVVGPLSQIYVVALFDDSFLIDSGSKNHRSLHSRLSWIDQALIDHNPSFFSSLSQSLPGPDSLLINSGNKNHTRFAPSSFLIDHNLSSSLEFEIM